MAIATVVSYISLNWLVEVAARVEAMEQLREGASVESIDLELTTRKFELNEMCLHLLGSKGRIVMDLCISLYMFATLWSYTSVWVSSITSTIPVVGVTDHGHVDDLKACDIYDSDKLPSECEHAYMLYTAIFVLLVVPLSCAELTETVKMQVALTIFRFVALFTMIVTCLTGLWSEPYVRHSTSESTPYVGDGVLAWRWHGTVNIISSAIFALMTHHSVSSIVQPIVPKASVNRVFLAASLATAGFYLVVSICAVLYYGDAVKAVVSLNWSDYAGAVPRREPTWWSHIVRYLIVLFPVVDIVSAYPLTAVTLGNNLVLLASDEVKARYGHRRVLIFFRILAAFPPIIGGFFVRDLSKIIQFTGLLGVMIAFIIPGLLQIKSRTALEAMLAEKRAAESPQDSKSDLQAQALISCTRGVGRTPYGLPTGGNRFVYSICAFALVALFAILAGIFIPGVRYGDAKSIH